MAKKVALFQDITLGFDGSAGLRYLKSVVDDDGNSIGGAEPHRLAIQPDCDDVRGAVLAENDAIAQWQGCEVINGGDLADYVDAIVASHRADHAVGANLAAWVTKDADRKARMATEEAEMQFARDAAAARAQEQADAAEASRKVETQALIDAAIAAALAKER